MSGREELEEGSAFTPRFDDKGLIPAICTDASTGEVLMFAWMNREALEISVQSRTACYWSRSRGKLWRKGETSGNTQEIVEIRTDCDQDVVWLSVKQTSGACHTGRKSCFYRSVPLGAGTLDDVELAPADAERLFNPKDIYGE